ncbi:MAG: hypothetical protein P4L82_01135 [Ancalomicrobiaceae bacterium]|nr:hypothetical protein [Ancalomicrobiaceae bacterium]
MITPRLDDDAPEKPLDPAVLRVQQRLKRMMVWSRGIMLVGFAALFGVIFYKFYWVQPTPGPNSLSVARGQTLVQTLPLPDGAKVAAARLDGDKLIVTLETAKGASILVIDAQSLQTLRRLDFAKSQ